MGPSHIVDQTRGPQPYRARNQYRPLDTFYRLKRIRVSELKIFDAVLRDNARRSPWPPRRQSRYRPLAPLDRINRIRSARDNTGAISRCAGVKCLFRELSARPSSSRTVATGRRRPECSDPATIRRMIASCCASFSPKYARSGWTIPNSFSTTVATPRKCPGRCAPHRCAPNTGDSTNVNCSRG